jgi:hypothetical protein
MKQRGYTVRIQPNEVSIEHRASIRPRTVVLLSVAYLGYCFLPDVRKILMDFYGSRDPVVAGFAVFMLLIPFLFGATWLFFASGEVMHCDARELHFARRRTLGRWHRLRFPSSEVKALRREFRGTSKSRSYTVLTFQHNGKRFEMLEDLNSTDSDRVLKACKSMGVDAVIVVDDAAAMNKDIARRGWLINPLRPDRDDHSESNR